MPPAPPGGPVTRIGLDASEADAGIEKLLRKVNLLSAGMKALAISTLRYNDAGKIQDAVVRGMTEKGNKIDVFLKRVKGGWEVTSQSVGQSIDKIIRDQEKLARETAKKAQEYKNYTNTMDFRKKLGTVQRTEIPKSAGLVEQRFFISAQRDLEKFVAAGDITAKRAKKILDDLKAGVKGRLKGVEEDFRVAGLRMLNAAQNVRDKIQKAELRRTATADAGKVKGILDTAFGAINPAASAGSLGRIENTFNRLAASVESTSVPLTRFQDLVTKTLGGVADPANKAERSVVRLVKSITAEFDKAGQAGQKLIDAQARLARAGAAEGFIKGRLGGMTRGLGEQDQERIQAQIARIQNLINRPVNGLSDAGFKNAFDTGLKGGRGAFVGVEEQARKSAARIRQIIMGQLKDPFSIKLALENNFNLIQKLYMGQFLVRMVENFRQVVDAAAEYQRSIALIQTITDDVRVPFDKWGNSIRRVSDELGKPIAEVAGAAYDVLSNQVTKGVDDTVSVLRKAGQFARITNSNTEDSINLLSSAINTFRLQSGDADRVAAQFFTTIDLGRVKTAEMANTIGRSAVYAKTLGVTLEELQAGIITITQTGQKADSSFTLLNNVFQKLLNPTKELQELYDKLGVGTGEIFVKTYGFTGALKVLAAQTGGSAAKLADFFNEIRAFGGIDALISRSRIFEDALKQLGTSAEENADKAKQKFDQLPGQRFLEEMNKIKNLFLTTFQTNLLQRVLSLTDHIGGLANAIKLATLVTVPLGTALAAVWGVSKVSTYIGAVLEVDRKMALLNGTWAYSALVQRALWIGGAVAIVGLITYMQQLHQESVDYYDDLKEAADRAAEKQVDANERVLSKIRKSHDEALTLERKRSLEALQIQTKAAQERVEIEQKAGKRIAESTQNAFETAYGTARNLLDELRNKQKESLKVADDFRRTGRARITNERDENLFRNRLQRNDTLFGGNANTERALYRNRLKQLNTLIVGASKRGDMETATKFLDQKDQILNEIANKTVKVGNRTYMKYSGGDQALIKAAEYRYKIEEKIVNLREKEGLKLQETINKEGDQLKELEDAFKEVYDFKLEDKGKPIDDSQEAALKRFDAAVLRARQLSDASMKTAAGRDPHLTRNLLNRQLDLAFGRGTEMRANIVKQFAEVNDLERIKKLQQAAIQGIGDDAQERFTEATARAGEARKKYIDSWNDLGTELKNLVGRTGVLPTDPTGRTIGPNPNRFDRNILPGATLKRAKLQGEIDTALKSGNFDLALKKTEELMELFKEAGVLKKKLYGEDGRKFTVEALVKRIKDKILAAQAANRETGAAEAKLKEADETRNASSKALDSLKTHMEALGPTSEAITAKLIADQGKFRETLAETEAVINRIIQKRAQIGPNKAEEAEGRLNARDGKYRTENLKPGTVIDANGNILKKAMGGYIHPGAPSGTDNIPAWLTKGEYVMPADKTERYRPILERMRAGHFATGGEIQIGGHSVLDALRGGIYGDIKGRMKKHQAELKSKMEQHGHALGSRNRVTPYFDDYEAPSLGFADGGIVGDFKAQLRALNGGFGAGSSGAGGGNTNVGDINITVQGGDSGKATVQEIGRELDRALRRKAINLRVNR